MSPSERCQWLILHRASPQIFESCGPLAFQSTLGLWLLRIMRPRVVSSHQQRNCVHYLTSFLGVYVTLLRLIGISGP